MRDLFKLIADFREKWALHSECWGEERTPGLADAEQDDDEIMYDEKLLQQSAEQACYASASGAQTLVPEEKHGETEETAEEKTDEKIKKKKKVKRRSSAASSKSEMSGKLSTEALEDGEEKVPCEPGFRVVAEEAAPLSPVPEAPEVLMEDLTPEEQAELAIVTQKIAALEAEALRLGIVQLDFGYML